MFSPFWPSLPGPGRQPNEPFLAQICFLKKQSTIRVFRAFDWCSSISGAKIVTQKLIWQKSKSNTKGMICPLRSKFGQT